MDHWGLHIRNIQRAHLTHAYNPITRPDVKVVFIPKLGTYAEPKKEYALNRRCFELCPTRGFFDSSLQTIWIFHMLEWRKIHIVVEPKSIEEEAICRERFLILSYGYYYCNGRFAMTPGEHKGF